MTRSLPLALVIVLYCTVQPSLARPVGWIEDIHDDHVHVQLPKLVNTPPMTDCLLQFHSAGSDHHRYKRQHDDDDGGSDHVHILCLSSKTPSTSMSPPSSPATDSFTPSSSPTDVTEESTTDEGDEEEEEDETTTPEGTSDGTTISPGTGSSGSSKPSENQQEHGPGAVRIGVVIVDINMP